MNAVSIGKIDVDISADTRELTQALARISRLVAGEATVMDLVRADPSVSLFWLACILIPAVLVAIVR